MPEKIYTLSPLLGMMIPHDDASALRPEVVTDPDDPNFRPWAVKSNNHFAHYGQPQVWQSGKTYRKNDVTCKAVDLPNCVCTGDHVAGATFEDDSAHWRALEGMVEGPAQKSSPNTIEIMPDNETAIRERLRMPIAVARAMRAPIRTDDDRLDFARVVGQHLAGVPVRLEPVGDLGRGTITDDFNRADTDDIALGPNWTRRMEIGARIYIRSNEIQFREGTSSIWYWFLDENDPDMFTEIEYTGSSSFGANSPMVAMVRGGTNDFSGFGMYPTSTKFLYRMTEAGSLVLLGQGAVSILTNRFIRVQASGNVIELQDRALETDHWTVQVSMTDTNYATQVGSGHIGRTADMGTTRNFDNHATGAIPSGQTDPHPGTPTLRQVEQLPWLVLAASATSTFATPLADTTRAFITSGMNQTTAEGNSSFLTTTAITSTTQATHARVGTSGTTAGHAHMAEFSAGVTVDHGSFTGATSGDVTLTYNFDLDQAFVLASVRQPSTTFTNQFPYVYLWNDAGTKKLHIEQAAADAVTEYQVIQINGAVVQRRNMTIAAGSAFNNFTLSPAVDLGRTFPIFYQKNGGGANTNVGERMLHGFFNSASNYQVQRSGGTMIEITDVRAEFVTLPEPMTVQNFTMSMLAGAAQVDQAITAVASGIILNSSSQTYGRTTHSTSATPQYATASAEFTVPANMRATRGITAGASANFGVAAIDFAPGIVTPINPAAVAIAL